MFISRQFLGHHAPSDDARWVADFIIPALDKRGNSSRPSRSKNLFHTLLTICFPAGPAFLSPKLSAFGREQLSVKVGCVRTVADVV